MLESHSTLDGVSKATNIPEASLKTMFDIRPGSRELQLSISVSAKADEGVPLLRALISSLRKESARVARDLGEQQSLLVKDVLDAREQSLKEAQTELVKFQKSFTSALNPEESRSRVLGLTQELEILKRTYSESLAAANLSASGSDAFPPANEAITRLRRSVKELTLQQRDAEISLGPKAPSVVVLSKRLANAKDAYDKELAGYVGAINNGLEPNMARMKLGVYTKMLELESHAARVIEGDAGRIERCEKIVRLWS